MSISNPERVATKQDLKDFYDIIFPYLGGNAEAGFTPIGTIIAVMGNSAPTNYLACNGQVVNIADYPELANYFKAQFGSYNYFGGNGTTTFAICDLRGEFLRGTGTNSHANQGSGASVGTHQDSTDIEAMVLGTNPVIPAVAGEAQSVLNYDSLYKLATNKYVINSSLVSSSDNYYQYRTVRPTNTSVLYCIATKNIYMNPSLSFTEEEKVVGQWVDGKKLYQKSLSASSISSTGSLKISHGISNFGRLVAIVNFSFYDTSDSAWRSGGRYYSSSNLNYSVGLEGWTCNSTYLMLQNNMTTSIDWSSRTSNVVVTMQYTKTS